MNRALRRLSVALTAVLLVSLAACTEADADRRTGSPTEVLAPADPPEVVASELASAPAGEQLALRRGERRMTLTMPSTYTPSAPAGAGTDDYRCFLLDPGTDEDVWLTGSHVLPGNPGVVHHVILFRVPPDQVAEAQSRDAEHPGAGWTCFGGTGLPGDFQNIDDAPWLAAWAPGGAESRIRDGYGVPLKAGSRIVMQVHYNLLEGAEPDRSSAQLRWMPGNRRLTPLHTFLLPSPVELPCRPGHDESPLCDRDAAVADVTRRFGAAGATNDLLYLLCGGSPRPSQVSSCTRRVPRGMTVVGAAGHMHLLGRKLRIEVNPGTVDAQTVLDIPLWDFDNQGMRDVEQVHLDRLDSVRVTCTHQQWLRDVLPAFRGQDERYVVWGEGSTDEMCLGLLHVAYDE